MNIVIYLIQHGATPDVPTIRGETPLHLAARANQADIIRILLRNGADVNAKARVSRRCRSRSRSRLMSMPAGTGTANCSAHRIPTGERGHCGDPAATWCSSGLRHERQLHCSPHRGKGGTRRGRLPSAGPWRSADRHYKGLFNEVFVSRVIAHSFAVSVITEGIHSSPLVGKIWQHQSRQTPAGERSAGRCTGKGKLLRIMFTIIFCSRLSIIFSSYSVPVSAFFPFVHLCTFC